MFKIYVYPQPLPSDALSQRQFRQVATLRNVVGEHKCFQNLEIPISFAECKFYGIQICMCVYKYYKQLYLKSQLNKVNVPTHFQKFMKVRLLCMGWPQISFIIWNPTHTSGQNYFCSSVTHVCIKCHSSIFLFRGSDVSWSYISC